MHGDLEEYAEPYVWSTLGGMNKSEYAKPILAQKYKGEETFPYDF